MNGLFSLVREYMDADNKDGLLKLKSIFKHDIPKDPSHYDTLVLFDKYSSNIKGSKETEYLAEAASVVACAKSISDVYILGGTVRENEGFRKIFRSSDFRWSLIDILQHRSCPDDYAQVYTHNLKDNTVLITDNCSGMPIRWHIQDTLDVSVFDMFPTEKEITSKHITGLAENKLIPTRYIFSYNYSSRKFNKTDQYLIYAKFVNRSSVQRERSMRISKAHAIYNTSYILWLDIVLNKVITTREDRSIIYID